MATDYTLGIDLNHYRPGFSIKAVKQAGGRFVIAKATEVWDNGATKFLDDQYKNYRDQTKNVYLPFGAFLYWRAGEDTQLQVDWYCENVGKDIDLPPAIDVERTNNLNIVSQDQAHDEIKEIAMLLLDEYNVSPLLYTSWWAWQSLTGGRWLAGSLPNWVANYTTAAQPLLPEPSQDWEFWQFTSSYPWPGQPKTADANRFNGNEGAFEEYVKVNKSLMYPEAPPPPPPPVPGLLPIELVLDGVKYVGEVEAAA